MLGYFDMMYYHLATFYQRFHKKTSGWQIQAAFIIGITQLILLSDIWLIIRSLLKIDGKFNVYEKIIFYSVGLFLIFYNIKRYEKKYRHYKSIWSLDHPLCEVCNFVADHKNSALGASGGEEVR